MQCFDAYSKRCLQNRKLILYKNNIDGARKFFKKFCADEDFQRGKQVNVLCLMSYVSIFIKTTNLRNIYLSIAVLARSKSQYISFKVKAYVHPYISIKMYGYWHWGYSHGNFDNSDK